jgi:hypothetical protein
VSLVIADPAFSCGPWRVLARTTGTYAVCDTRRHFSRWMVAEKRSLTAACEFAERLAAADGIPPSSETEAVRRQHRASRPNPFAQEIRSILLEDSQ